MIPHLRRSTYPLLCKPTIERHVLIQPIIHLMVILLVAEENSIQLVRQIDLLSIHHLISLMIGVSAFWRLILPWFFLIVHDCSFTIILIPLKPQINRLLLILLWLRFLLLFPIIRRPRTRDMRWIHLRTRSTTILSWWIKSIVRIGHLIISLGEFSIVIRIYHEWLFLSSLGVGSWIL